MSASDLPPDEHENHDATPSGSTMSAAGPTSGAAAGRRASAAALCYRPGDQAPRLIAKGYGTIAENIIQTAREHGLYVHESPELVGLLMQLDLDAHIPPALYQAIAELLAWLYGLEEDEMKKRQTAMPATS